MQSLVTQTYKHIEIILVDDGSPDLCPSKCDLWAEKDTRIRVIHKKNGGLSDARNTGIEQASGDYVYCIDSDDWASPDLIKSSVDVLLSNHADMVFFQYRFASEDGTKSFTSIDTPHFPIANSYKSREALAMLWEERMPNYAWSFVVKRNIYIKNNIQYPIGRLMEDLATTYRIVGSSSRVAFVHKELYYYRMRSGSILDVKTPRLVTDNISNIQDVDQYVDENFPDLKTIERNWSIKYLTGSMIWAYEIKEKFGNSYKDMYREIEMLVNSRISEIGFRSLTNVNKGKVIAERLGLMWLMVRISQIRHKNPVK